MWYSRQDDKILDMLIAPRETFRRSYDAARSRFRIGDDEVAFGNTHKAYIFDGGQWRTVPLKNLTEADLPSVVDLEKCASTGEIARKIVGE